MGREPECSSKLPTFRLHRRYSRVGMSNRPISSRGPRLVVNKVKELRKSSEPDPSETIGRPIIVTIGSERFAISYTVSKLKPTAAQVISIGKR